ncbi:tryptophan--tRNA ligase [Pseudoalteromonas luteoviolacea]|uniref:Tryptophan--tRNA ligase n=1 Tax=Pseudoalteromonas luteoviolacea S4054 TaxID=1129367 RepID=A0A0F6A7Z4_9GAMM|nr:tryptophan--tRNA ligase [Pseudoalteromonas luteoviolacea]AOT07770.1 tryptophan--tRNA ligase [Pseudoalteromonas luteoviolacea]AOT12686.1 tryptophan--tRNA ligase [Pseudoalteromonas luteoviolacea]AOT17599.1 tryptophan--tRNA ligase [Pseudoalteromonas luteoviolacea]KKE82253.1 tryptophanyl-tRNA synthetase [Pseudoalteromonas luteoviolacea S4054]KZN78905.1 tryptophanyl-tRNA synthetase [Pseudoalteromonas luteoviolacea S4047-1]
MTHTILTGDRPTGPLHLGHFVGSLQHRVSLQEEYNQTILIADMQGLTDNGHNPKKVADNIFNVMADYLAVGICPTKTTICLQSALPALAELAMYYANLVSVARLERNPTVKAEIASKDFGASIPAGFLSYPISQAADITAFDATLVPVGEDQLPMIELTNEIVRKLNNVAGKQVLIEAKPLLSEVSRLPGVDGKSKMSKSLGNVITFGSTDDEIVKAVRAMYTDPNHIRVDDPGQVEGNVVFTYLDAFHEDKSYVAALKEHYCRGGLGDSKLKGVLADCLVNLITPIRAKRAQYIADPAQLRAILLAGTEQANQKSQQVLGRVKQAFGLNIL